MIVLRTIATDFPFIYRSFEMHQAKITFGSEPQFNFRFSKVCILHSRSTNEHAQKNRIPIRKSGSFFEVSIVFSDADAPSSQQGAEGRAR